MTPGPASADVEGRGQRNANDAVTVQGSHPPKLTEMATPRLSNKCRNHAGTASRRRTRFGDLRGRFEFLALSGMTWAGRLDPACSRIDPDDLESLLVGVAHDLRSSARALDLRSVPDSEHHAGSIHDLLTCF